MKKLFSYIAIFYFFFSLNILFPQQIDIKVNTDTTDYLIGDFINLNLKIRYEKNINIILPDVKNKLNEFEFINYQDTSTIDQNIINRKITYLLTSFKPGPKTIPSLEIRYSYANDTNSFSLFSDSLLINIIDIQIDTTKEIKDIKPPIEFKFNKYLYILLVLDILYPIFPNYVLTAILFFPEYANWFIYAYLGILLLLFLFYLWVRKTKKLTEAIFVDTRPAHIIALEQLDILSSKRLWQQGNVKEYYFGLKEIIKNYLEKRFDILALESTTTELLNLVKDISEAKIIYKDIEELFNLADLVIFAKHIPDAKLNEEAISSAREIVNKTIVPEISQTETENKENV